MEPEQAQIVFEAPEDDTPDNRDIVDLVERRERVERGPARDLDELIAGLGFDPATLLSEA